MNRTQEINRASDRAFVETRLRMVAQQLHSEGHDPTLIVEAMITVGVHVGCLLHGPGTIAYHLSQLASDVLDVAEQQLAERQRAGVTQ